MGSVWDDSIRGSVGPPRRTGGLGSSWMNGDQTPERTSGWRSSEHRASLKKDELLMRLSG